MSVNAVDIESFVITFDESDNVPISLKGKTIEFKVVRNTNGFTTGPMGIVTNDPLVFFNRKGYSHGPWCLSFTGDVKPGYQWRILLNTLGVKDQNLATYELAENDDPFFYDSWNTYKRGITRITVRQ
uniref:Uncharacterized protein n=1 Tax=Clandestinovirus TaxID=2831644 RepID=A0A8F8KQX5_9VIRU|nr:hypothetical protein KOM_12_107 [Clandestinovirus]